jgi:hypothetical protein
MVVIDHNILLDCYRSSFDLWRVGITFGIVAKVIDYTHIDPSPLRTNNPLADPLNSGYNR